jgi:hypothetical protein
MDSKSYNNTFNAHYTQISDKNPNEIPELETLYPRVYNRTTRKKTLSHKFHCYSNYGLIFFGIVTLILMVVFGINNVATSFRPPTTENLLFLVENSTTEAEITETTIPTTEAEITETTIPTTEAEITETTIPTTEAEITETTIPTTEAEITETTIPTTEENIDNLDYAPQELLKDIVISNKTVIIDSPNNSVIITN